jgi:hypothetical protein
VAAFDNAELLTDIRDRGSLPSADIRFTDAKLLSTATIELRDVLATLLVESQANRMVYLSDMAVTAGVASYRLPTRAVAGRWQSVGWKGSGDTAWTRLKQVHPEDYYLQSDSAQATPRSFFVRDYALVLVPTPSAAGTLRLPYYMRPNTLVATTAAGVVASLTSTTATLASVPSGFTSGLAYDVVRATPGFETLVAGVTATLSSSTLTFASAMPTDTFAPAVGDYVCLAGQAPVAQCPVEVRGLLATRAARRALVAVNEAQQASMLDNNVVELTEVARSLLSPRVDSEPQEWGDVRRGLLYGVL